MPTPPGSKPQPITDLPDFMMGLGPDKPTVKLKISQVNDAFNTSNLLT